MGRIKAGKTRIYDIWYKRMTEEGLTNNQQFRFYTLGIVARKYDISRSIIDRDLRLLHDSFRKLSSESPLSLSECETAFDEGFNEPKYDRFSYWLLCSLANISPICDEMSLLEKEFPVIEEFPPLRQGMDDLSPFDVNLAEPWLFPEIKLEILKERLKQKK